MTTVTTRMDGPVAHVRLDGPQRRNALDLAAMRRLADALHRVTTDPAVGAVVISGAGGAFCAGADLDPDVPVGSDPNGDAAMMAAVDRVIRGIVHAPVPVLAAVEGAAAGVGASIAFACDLVVAARTAFFLLPFTGIGLLPDGGATLTVAAAAGRARAMRLALRGERLPATEALAVGLIAEVSDETDRTVAEWAAALAAGPRAAQAATKAAINAATVPGLDAALARETREQLPLLSSADYREGVTAFLERRRPASGS
ncbi:enoyl-CoA hydratase-related protein [Nocardia stercoris]|uniref:Enoyl-CoA hydratase n=1 Tax=Nocardia stercoris TaxID=2483361 RepID=A0A3M2L9T2_9NOCA|nr:enoyl-CoA hydratase-related protein [Nocardia stercoris]RMI31338.1 enoyl-CoA hydratase [Nocardia stercoris]